MRAPFRKRVKYRARRWLLLIMREIDYDFTLEWACKRGWIGSYENNGAWYMRDDEGRERV